MKMLIKKMNYLLKKMKKVKAFKRNLVEEKKERSINMIQKIRETFILNLLSLWHY